MIAASTAKDAQDVDSFPTAPIRAGEGSDRHTPIVAMTAGARREDRARCLAAGMDHYLAMPGSKDALLAMVARCIPATADPSPIVRAQPVLAPPI